MNEHDPNRLTLGMFVYIPSLFLSGIITNIKSANTSSSFLIYVGDVCVDSRLVYLEDELTKEELEKL